MGYDYHGNWDGKTGHVAPLYYTEGDKFPTFNVVSVYYQFKLDTTLFTITKVLIYVEIKYFFEFSTCF